MDAHGGVLDGGESQGGDALGTNISAVGGTGTNNGVDLQATVIF